MIRIAPAPHARLLAASLLSAFATLGAQAANLTWGLTGAGSWDTASLNWNDGVGNVVWNNANNDNATFGTLAAAATATLGSNITVNNLTFGSGTGINNLAGGAGLSLTVNGVITASRTATITAVIAGSNGLTKAGASTLTLQAVNTYTGPTIIQNTTLQARTTGALPASTTVTIGSGTNNATLDVRANQTIAGLVKGGTGTSTITQSQTLGAITLTINPSGAGVSAADSSFSGTIRDGDATHNLALAKAGSNTLTLTGINSYSGATTVSGGTLKLGSSLTAGNGVTVSGGILSGNDSSANIALGTGAVSLASGAIAPGGLGTAGAFTVGPGQNLGITGGSLRFDLGSASDQIFGSGGGIFSIAGATLDLNLVSGFTYNASYPLLSGFGGSSSVSSLAITGYDTVNWTAGLGTDGVLSFTPTAVPEPSAFALLAGGLTLAAGVLRRRRNA